MFFEVSSILKFKSIILKRIFYIVFLFAILIKSQTISITGLVKSSKNGEPIPYANISIKNTNYGTVSNAVGKFNLSLDASSYKLVVSCIGYASKTISVNSSSYLRIELNPVVYMLGEVIVSSLTWAEKFILKAIAKKNKQLQNLNYYVADAYSKTIFRQKSLGIVGLIESISKIGFKKPNLYSEELISNKLTENLSNIPYEFIAINQEINFISNTFKVANFELISPLNDNALDYYNFEVKQKTLLNTDTIVVLHVTPRKSDIPLLEGNLYFLMDTHQLLEADVEGNSFTRNSFQDSLKIYQKYTLKDSVFNLPSFVKFSLRMNFFGLYFNLEQQYTFINYTINNSQNEPFIIPDKQVVERPSKNIKTDSTLIKKFNVPLSQEETEFNNTVQRVFVDGPFYKKAITALFSYLPRILFDQPLNIFGYDSKKFSNLYRFNKVEGHYAGLEYQFFDTQALELYTKAGYAFGLKQSEYNIHFRWRQLILDFHKDVINLGRFDYLQSIKTFNALFYHEDPFHYYKSFGGSAKFLIPLSSRITFTPQINLEKEQPLDNSSKFSFFRKNLTYPENFRVASYNDNNIGFTLSFIENRDYLTNKKKIYSGQSFTNILSSFKFASEKFLKSTESFSEIDVNLVTHQELFSPFVVTIESDYHHINKTGFVNKMSFANNLSIFQYIQSPLSLYTLDNYSYYVQDYFKINTELNLYNLPQILFIKPSIGVLFTYLKPLNQNDLGISFNYLTDDFYEYGVVIKGLTFLNLYLLKNNINPKDFFIKINFTF